MSGVCRVNRGPRACDLPLLGAAVTASDGGSVAARVPPDWSDWEATLTAVKITWVMSLAGSCLWLGHVFGSEMARTGLGQS